MTISLFSLCSTEMRARAKLKEGRLERKEQESLSFKGPEWRGSNSVHDYLQVSLTNCGNRWPLHGNLLGTLGYQLTPFVKFADHKHLPPAVTTE